MSQSGRNAALKSTGIKSPVGGMPEKIHVVLWKWTQDGFRSAYTSEHVNIVCDMIRRNRGNLPLRVVCVTDDPEGITGCETYPLWGDHSALPNRSGIRLPSCYRRLKLFDAETQAAMDIRPGHRIVSLDLDVVITGELAPLWLKSNHFVGWAVRGTHHLRVFNGSMWMFTAGTHQNMWSDFDPESTPDKCHRAGYMGSDQSWLSYNFAKDGACGTWSYPMMVSYPKEVARRPVLTAGVRLVSFHGRRKPWFPEVQRECPWVKHHWMIAQPSAATAPVAEMAAAAAL